jgi:hypothetical protein
MRRASASLLSGPIHETAPYLLTTSAYHSSASWASRAWMRAQMARFMYFGLGPGPTSSELRATPSRSSSRARSAGARWSGADRPTCFDKARSSSDGTAGDCWWRPEGSGTGGRSLGRRSGAAIHHFPWAEWQHRPAGGHRWRVSPSSRRARS